MGRRSRGVLGATLVFALIAIGAGLWWVRLPAVDLNVEPDQLPPVAIPQGARTDLRILLVRDGRRYDSTEAIGKALDARGVDYTEVDLRDSKRPPITADFLADEINGFPHAKFQAIILPQAAPKAMSTTEIRLIHKFQESHGIRGLITGAEPEESVGLRESLFSGSLDGITAHVTNDGLSGAFSYLRGPLYFPNLDDGQTSFGQVAQPMPQTPARKFTPIVTAAAPRGGRSGSLLGILATQGREDLVSTFAMDESQLPTLALSEGIINWLTKGVHLGLDRSAFNVHVDDVLLPNFTWNSKLKCTPGSGDCPAVDGVPVPSVEVRMTAADVDKLLVWQRQNNFTLDMVFNAAGVETERAAHEGVDELAEALLSHKNEFTWINHTWSHAFLGCIRDFTVVPWECETSLLGATRWNATRTVYAEIQRNIVWARQNDVTIVDSELVTGEHGGLRRLPQEPQDNPNFVRAVDRLGIKVLGADDLAEPETRHVGTAIAVPRHAVDIFYDTATRKAAVSQYDWRLTSRAQGGSGDCEHTERTTCLAPLISPSAFDAVISPRQAAAALAGVLSNDPRTYYVHQSNLVNVDPKGALLYPYLNEVLRTYRRTFAENRPLLQWGFTESSDELIRQELWRQARLDGSATAYVVANTLVIENQTGDAISLPVTSPEGTTTGQSGWGTAYAGQRSAWMNSTATPLVLTLPRAPWSVAP